VNHSDTLAKSSSAAAPVVAVIGGGISGLATAHHLHHLARHAGLPLNLRLIESSDRLGGLLRTVHMDDCLLEAGPDSILTEKKAALALCQRLGLADEVIYPSQGSGICILNNGRITPLPLGFKMVAPTRIWPVLRSPLFTFKGKARMAGDLFRPVPGFLGDESLGAFVRRRLGREVLERAVQPILAGIFLGDADRLSINMVMPQLAGLEGKFGSVIRGLRAQLKKIQRPLADAKQTQTFFSLRGGVGRLTERLAEDLPKECLHFGLSLTRVRRDEQAMKWILESRQAAPFQADAVIFACPFFATARMLSESMPALADDLASTRYASCATVNLIYDKAHIRHQFDHNGFFVPLPEGLSFLACNFVQVKYPTRVPAGKAVLRVFVGGSVQADLLAHDDSMLTHRVHSELAALLGIEAPPQACYVHRYDRAMPQFEVGYQEKLRRIQGHLAASPGLFLAGGGMGAVGIPDCIALGEDTARTAMDFLAASARLLTKTG